MKRIAMRIMRNGTAASGRESRSGRLRSWREEYYRRRHDPYWKNDSDYD
jgi:hypothetical protein